MMRFPFRRFSIALVITFSITWAGAFLLAAPSGAVAQTAEKLLAKLQEKS
jgi:hypothetical protein